MICKHRKMYEEEILTKEPGSSNSETCGKSTTKVFERTFLKPHRNQPTIPFKMAQIVPLGERLARMASFDDRFDHLYSYSSNLDLFEHQLFKAEKRRKSQTSQQSIHDGFDLNQETKWLMDRTDQLKEKNDREWVI